MSGLEIGDLHKRFGSQLVLAGLELSVPAESFTAILGASGSGKTTLLRLLAGFERPDRGTISIGGTVVDAADRHVRPEQRRIGYVPQEGTLFPHLTVEANVGFGLRRSGRRARVAELLELVGLGALGARYPQQLSGGQQQRVALARALAIEPDVVLLDEPFVSLDTNLRAAVREDVRSILRAAGTTAILVTHDQDEALSLADNVAVLRDGRIAQLAAPEILYGEPVDARLASFIGLANLLDGTISGGHVDTALGRLEVSDGVPQADGTPVTVLVRPEQLELRDNVAAGFANAEVVRAGYHGHDSVIYVEAALARANRSDVDVHQHHLRLIARASGNHRFEAGSAVGVTVVGPVYVWPRSGSGPDGSAGTDASPP
ncbi:MAG TPA: ABC transporter ATP-binding protein [Gaiellaceae bacterium]|nr:ABC transporter ATP-binding protein [Gaiellaceae bacterium]